MANLIHPGGVLGKCPRRLSGQIEHQRARRLSRTRSVELRARDDLVPLFGTDLFPPPTSSQRPQAMPPITLVHPGMHIGNDPSISRRRPRFAVCLPLGREGVCKPTCSPKWSRGSYDLVDVIWVALPLHVVEHSHFQASREPASPHVAARITPSEVMSRPVESTATQAGA